MWTKFMDMHSGGGSKEKHDFIFIEADSEEAAIQFFTERFGHDPYHVTCNCCGSDYSVSSEPTLEELTAYYRGDRGDDYPAPLMSLQMYVMQPDVLVIPAAAQVPPPVALNAALDACARRAGGLSRGEKLAHITAAYDVVMADTESFEVDLIGSDLAYLMGAIAKGDTMELRSDRALLPILRKRFDADSWLWDHVKVVPG